MTEVLSALVCSAAVARRLRPSLTMTCTATMWRALLEWACRSCLVSRQQQQRMAAAQQGSHSSSSTPSGSRRGSTSSGSEHRCTCHERSRGSRLHVPQHAARRSSAVRSSAMLQAPGSAVSALLCVRGYSTACISGKRYQLLAGCPVAASCCVLCCSQRYRPNMLSPAPPSTA